MVWPGSFGTGMNYQWIGPEHDAKQLRALKHHLSSGGIVFAQRPAGEKAPIVSRGAHERTSDHGTLLNVYMFFVALFDPKKFWCH